MMAELETGGELVVREVELELTSPRKITPSFAVAAVAGIVLLSATSAAWLVGVIVAIASLLAHGEFLPIVVMAGTAWLVARGWAALYQSLSARMRPPDLSATALLPDSYWTLSPQLRRLLLDTRTSRESLRDRDIDRADLLRQLFAWVTCIAEVEGPNRDLLRDHHIDGHRLREEIASFYDRPDLRERALDLLDRFEAGLLDRSRDPFR